MAYSCYKCSAQLELGTPPHIGRKDECTKCKSDLHCCKNCTFFDQNAYNGCREPQAERVVDKERSNFCDFFRIRDSSSGKKSEGIDPKSKALSELDNLFKK